MSSINATDDLIRSYPLWYFINDFLIVIINLIGIFVTILFISMIIRLDHPSYSISNLIACKTCLAIGLVSFMISLNTCYALASDFRGGGYNDPLCLLRGSLFTIFYVDMYTSLCLKAFNRLRCIVYRSRSLTNSSRSLLIRILLQWFLVAILVLPMIVTDGIDYDWGSHLCLVTMNKPWQFVFFMVIYYISMTFISSVYLYILNYVFHLSPLEQYRRKRQVALLRRILTLLSMLLLPGIFYSILIIYWTHYRSLPSYILKLKTLIDSIAHTGVIITIFISNTRLRDQCYHQPKKPLQRIRQEHLEIHLLPISRRQMTTLQTSLTLERIPFHSLDQEKK